MRGPTDPFERMDRMFEQMRQQMQQSMAGETLAGGGTLTVEETDEGYVAFADLPGFEPEGIDVTFEDGLLTVAASNESESDAQFRRRSVSESVRIPGHVDADETTATYRNGVLEVTLPAERPELDAHRIDVE